jgi:hypothetical protein
VRIILPSKRLSAALSAVAEACADASLLAAIVANGPLPFAGRWPGKP